MILINFVLFLSLELGSGFLSLRPSSRGKFTHIKMSTDPVFDFDIAIVGCGVGGHGAALHARANGMKTAVFTGKDVGGTCVNRQVVGYC